MALASAFENQNENEAKASKDAISNIKAFYEPSDGPMAKVLDALEESHKTAHKTSDMWARNAAAMNQAYRGIYKATEGAQNVMMHDAINVNDLVRNQVLHETLFQQPLSVDPKDRQKIRKENGDSRHLPVVDKDGNKNSGLKGSKVIITGRYSGERKHLVRGHIGVLEKYLPDKDKWQLKLTDERLDDASLKPEAKIGELEVLPK